MGEENGAGAAPGGKGTVDAGDVAVSIGAGTGDAAVPAGAPQSSASQAAKTERMWLMTEETGLLKMVHPGTRRTAKQWDILDDVGEGGQEEEKKKEPLNLQVVRKERDDVVSTFIYVDAKGQTGFELNEHSLRVASAEPRILEDTPLEIGDVITAVNGSPVANFEAYTRAIKDLKEFSISFNPSVEARPGATADMVAIEFESVEVIVKEGSGKAKIFLRRNGNTACRLEWRWSLENGTVVDRVFGKLGQEGRAVFEADQRNTSIEVDVPKDPSWNAEAVFFIHLDPEPLSAPPEIQVMLGDNKRVALYSCNMDSFPAGIFGQLDSEETFHNQFKTGVSATIKLINGFWDHEYSEMPQAARRGMFLMLLPPIVGYFSSVLWQTLVDCGLTNPAEGVIEGCGFWRSQSLGGTSGGLAVIIIVVILRFALTVLDHVISVLFRRLKLGGKARLKLRASVFCTMLQLAPSEKDFWNDGALMKLLDVDTDLAITSIWQASFTLVRELAALVMDTVLTITMVSSLSLTMASLVVASLPLQILLLCLFLALRGPTLSEKYDKLLLSNDAIAAFVKMCSGVDTLLNNYKKGWVFTQQYLQCHADSNALSYGATVYKSDTVQILKYSYTAILAAVTIGAGQAVPNGPLPFGSFLILVQAIGSFGSSLTSIAEILNDMVVGSAAVRMVALLLNCETRRLQRCMNTARDQSRDPSLTYDDKILLEAVQYRYQFQDAGSKAAVSTLSIAIPAGRSLVCFPTTSVSQGNRPGINTLFKLISGELLPQSGKILLPSRWRLIYVPVVPILFDGTLMYNIMFSDRAKDRKVVWDVCRSLGLSPSLLENDDFDVGPGGSCMKFSDRVIVSIARALLHDVDLLLISSALDVLGEARALKVLRFLRGYTQRRGLSSEPLPEAIRHRKTVIYTSKFKHLQDQATHEMVISGETDPAGVLGGIANADDCDSVVV